MDFLTETYHATRRNIGTVLVYMAVVVGFDTLARACNLMLKGWLANEAHAGLAHTYRFVSDVTLAGIFSLAQAVAFSRLGAEIDRPLWRSSGMGDALRRFFRLWFIINLAGVAISCLPMLASGGDNAQSLALFSALLLWGLTVVCIPMGACVMFRGAMSWDEAAHYFTPLLHEAPRALLLFILSSLQIVLNLDFLQISHGLKSGWTAVAISPLFTTPSAFLECFVFAGTWLICMTHREHGEDADFDF